MIQQVLASSERDDGSKFPTPRQFQIDAHNELRQGFKDGHKNQLIMAPTGAGKTYWSLQMATELADGGKIAVIDTERSSASLYADKFEFDTLLGTVTTKAKALPR